MTDQQSRAPEGLEERAEKWLRDNDFDYEKYGDRRGDRSAYNTLMMYEVSDYLLMAYEAGAKDERASQAAALAEIREVLAFYASAFDKKLTESMMGSFTPFNVDRGARAKALLDKLGGGK